MSLSTIDLVMVLATLDGLVYRSSNEWLSYSEKQLV